MPSAITRISLVLILSCGNLAVGGSEQQLGRLEAQLERLLLRYTEKHPDVIRLRAEIERVREGLARPSAPFRLIDGPLAERDDAIGLRSARPVEKTFFSFKKTGKLIERPEGMPAPGPYWPTLVNMREVESFPFDYALYFSTDHHRGKGGIWLYVCSGIPSDAGCWRSYDDVVAAGAFDHIARKPGRNPIYVDTVQGNQTETPHANVIDGAVYMTYHNNRAGHAQSTLLATSSDGVNFARINGDADSVILDYDSKTAPGDGHTGYFRWGPNPFENEQYRYIGYSLHGGGLNPNSAMWGSNDAIRWTKVAVLNRSRFVDLGNGQRLFWQIDPNSIRKGPGDLYVAIAAGGVPHYGRQKRPARLYEVYLSSDGLKLVDYPTPLLSPGRSIKDDALMEYQPTAINIAGTWHLIFTGVSKNGTENFILAAVETLD